MRTIEEICKIVEEDYKGYISQRRSLYEAFEEKKVHLSECAMLQIPFNIGDKVQIKPNPTRGYVTPAKRGAFIRVTDIILGPQYRCWALFVWGNVFRKNGEEGKVSVRVHYQDLVESHDEIKPTPQLKSD